MRPQKAQKAQKAQMPQLPQKAQMPQMAEHDGLDAAIDQVTARLVQVRGDEDLALRIVSVLPERSSRFGWLFPQVAAITAFAIAAVVWTARETTTPALLPSSDVAALVGVPDTVAAVAPGTVLGTARGTAFRTQPLEHLEPLELLEPLKGDHERSLAPLESMTALAVGDVAPGELAPTPGLSLAPLVVVDLPLTAESFSPR